MAERKKLKKKTQEAPVPAEITPSKLEYAIAKYLKNYVPTKKTKFLNHQVSYFNANKAVDVLLDSTWATGDDPLFTDRASVVEFGNKLLQLKFFHRAKKIAVTDKDLSPKKLKKKQEKLKEKEKDKKKEALKKREESEESKKEEEKTQDEGERQDDKGKEKKEKQKKRTKIKLDMHLEQVFVDGSEAYVWMYDPIPFWYYIAGASLLFAAVAICLFPLWPPVVRKGVYYLSIGAAGFLGVILGLAIIRFIIFVLIWALSLGRHHFWILPNLTEDVGFFASFWPLYHYEYRGATYDSKKKLKKKHKGDEDDDEDDKDNETDDGGHRSSKKSDNDEGVDSVSNGETDKHETDVERTATDQAGITEETDSDDNSNSQTFEMVNKDDLSGEDKEDLSGEDKEDLSGEDKENDKE